MSSSTSSQRDRTLKIAASVLLILAITFVGGLFYLKSKAAATPQVSFPKPPDPALVAKTEDAKLKQATALRTKLEPWAKSHQTQIAAMLNAPAGDKAALDAVIKLIPSVPTTEKTGIDMKDVEGADNPGDAAVVQTEWTHMPVGAKAAAPELEAQARDGERKVLLRDGVTFGQKRDVILVRVASVWSKKQYFLWSSGRVTEAESEAPELNKEDKQIAPPYDFLPASADGSSVGGASTQGS